MASSLKTVIYPVTDLASAKKLYGSLFGVDPHIDQPYYVAFTVGGQDVGLDPNGHGKGMTGPVPHWHVADINARLDEVVAAGGELVQAATDVGGGNLAGMVKDADGNIVGFIQAA